MKCTSIRGLLQRAAIGEGPRHFKEFFKRRPNTLRLERFGFDEKVDLGPGESLQYTERRTAVLGCEGHSVDAPRAFKKGGNWKFIGMGGSLCSKKMN